MKIIIIIANKRFFKNVHINNIKMLYDRIEVSEGIDVNKTSASNKYIICHNWYFLDKRTKLQLEVYNGCHNVLLMSMNLTNLAILNIRIVINYYLWN